MPVQDLGEFKGQFPYASELIGVYQPLLGWKSNQGKRRVSKQILENTQEIYNDMLKDSSLSKYVKVDLPTNVTLPEISSVPKHIAFSDFIDTTVTRKASLEMSKFIEENARTPDSAELRSMFNRHKMEELVLSIYKNDLGNSAGMHGSTSPAALTRTGNRVRNIDLTSARVRGTSNVGNNYDPKEAAPAILLTYMTSSIKDPYFFLLQKPWLKATLF